MIKVLELFGGIGACTKAFKKVGIPFNVVDYVEINEYSVSSYNAINGTNFKPQDISKWNKDIKVDFIMHGSPCFVAGTKVITDTGYKNIEDIQIEDKVLTHTNSFKPVTNLGSDGEKDIYKVETQGTLPIYCTDNHPFFVRHRNKIWNNELRRYEYSFSEPEKIRLYNLTKNNDFIGVPIIPDKENELYNLDDETLWLLGRYVADGYYYNKPRKDRPSNLRYTNICVGNTKRKDFENHIKSYSFKLDDNYKGCAKYRFGVKLTDLILKIDFGKGALNKRIPMKILQLPRNKLKIFLDGYMAGDGSQYKTTSKYQAATVSRELAESLVLVVQKVYNVGCAIYHIKRPRKHMIENRVVNQNDTYMIRYNLASTRKHYIVDNNCIWYPIKKITNMNKQETIYNITVQDDHTYTANNCYVGNCQDFSIAGTQKGGDKDSNTRSSLMYESIRIINKLHPNVVIWENVENLISDRHKHNYQKYLDTLSSFGYTNFYRVLNSKDYGIPQSRNRIFTISILDDTKFEFPREQVLDTTYFDYLEDTYDLDEVVLTANDLKMVKDFGAPYSFGGFVVRDNIYPTITASYGKVSGNSGKIKCKEGYRILTAKECWRLMGFDDEDYEKAAKVCQKSQLYKQAGNSIVVNVLEVLIADIYGVKLDKHYKLQQKKLF